MRKKQNISLELEITEVSKKGNGIGYATRDNGIIWKVEVPFTMKDDLVKVSLRGKKNGIHVGKLEEIIKSSSERNTPKCIHFGSCGGCRLQHIPYELQAKNKESTVINLFENLITQDVRVYPLLKADSPFNYRNKMEFSFSSDSSKNKYLGLIMDASRGKVLNLTECHLTNPWFIDALKAVKHWWDKSDLLAYHPSENSGSLRTLTVREAKNTGDRLVMLTVSGNPEFALSKEHLNSFKEALKNAVLSPLPDSTLSIFVRIQQIAKGMQTEFYEIHLSGKDHIEEILHIQLNDNDPTLALKFTVSPTAFFQPNTAQAEKLYSKALELAELSKSDVVYDLYCGTGTLGICMAKHVKTVIGVEISAESSLDAKTNATKNGLENFIVHTGDVGKILKEKKFPTPDVIMLDPPRAGLDDRAIEEILNLNAKKIVYISCNPETQSQNIFKLCSAGYKLICIQPVDQFPQTMHIENIALLTR